MTFQNDSIFTKFKSYPDKFSSTLFLILPLLGASGKFARVLYDKGINYELDIWGEDMTHDWPTWRKMLPYYLDSRF
ncbi:hypothetical protein BH20BAC1_BH20BAC1_21940 [soil metagenome]